METMIKQVLVYPDRALVQRRGEIALEPGVQLVEVSELPLSLNPDTLRVSARTAGDADSRAQARLLGVQVQSEHFSQAPAEQVRNLESQLEAVQGELAALDRLLELVKSKRQQVQGLMGQSEVFAKALASGEMEVEAQMKLFARLQEYASEMDAELGRLEGERREIERRLNQLTNQLEQLRSTRPPERFKAAVEIEVVKGGKFIFDLSYTVAKAGWKPLYDLRLSEVEGKSQLEVGFLAQVMQLSGEDWERVDLALSTARPALAATLPELKPWFIHPRPPTPPPMPVRPQARMATAKLSLDMSMEDTAVSEPVQVATAVVDTSGAAITYLAPARVDIPSDGSPHKVAVTHLVLAPKLDYVCAPRLVEAVYRRAKMVNDSQYLLLPGTANLFAGEEFIGATSLELTAPQGEIELYFGVEDRIRVERELIKHEVDKSLVGGKRRVHFGYELRLENLLGEPVKLTVHDQLPLGGHEDIKIRLENADPKPQEQNELNLLDWEINLTPGEKRSIRFGFAVEYPQEMQVIGLS